MPLRDQNRKEGEERARKGRGRGEAPQGGSSAESVQEKLCDSGLQKLPRVSLPLPLCWFILGRERPFQKA